MPVRTSQELTDRLDRELVWRKRELTTVKFQVQQARPHISAVMVRCGVCLLYAHWEGFVKAGARIYLEYVANRRLRYRELKRNFMVIGARRMMRGGVYNQSVKSDMELIDCLLDEESKFSVGSIGDVVTRSNLDWEVLSDILLLLGISNESYVAKRMIINNRLVSNRNKVAHGEICDLDSTDYVDLYGSVLDLMERFRDDLELAAVNRYYRS